ncbi:MAG: methyltransferase domain-containing protein [Thermomicrobiaceae bacterium]
MTLHQAKPEHTNRVEVEEPRWHSGWTHPLKQRLNPHEILDEGSHPDHELFGTFRDMRRVNHFLGGTAITLRGVTRLTGQLRKGDSLSILDIGTGHADIPREIDATMTLRGINCQLLGGDIDLATIRTGMQLPDNEGVHFFQTDIRALPFEDRSLDIALCSMTLHHLDDGQAVEALQEMARVSRLGIIINDLTRTTHGYAFAWLLGRLVTANRLTRHDAHRSILRGRSESELADLAHAAGLQLPVFDSILGYRTAMTVGVRAW